MDGLSDDLHAASERILRALYEEQAARIRDLEAELRATRRQLAALRPAHPANGVH